MRILDEFKEFAVKGNVIDMAVGIIIGGAFTPIARSLVDDIVMPPIGLLLGGVDFSDYRWTLKEAGVDATGAEVAAVTIDYGNFVNIVLTFLIVAFATFLLVRVVNRIRREEDEAPKEATSRDCPQCLMKVPAKATRCGHCTSAIA